MSNQTPTHVQQLVQQIKDNVAAKVAALDPQSNTTPTANTSQ